MTVQRCLRNVLILSVDEIETRSFGEWTSSSTGPSDTESIPFTRELMIPHSRPAWIAVTSASSPIRSFHACAQNLASGRLGSGVHAGYGFSSEQVAPAISNASMVFLATMSLLDAIEER